MKLVVGCREELEWTELGPGEHFVDVREYRKLEGLRYDSVRVTWSALFMAAELGLTSTLEVLSAGVAQQSYHRSVPVKVQSYADPWMEPEPTRGLMRSLTRRGW